MPRNKRSIQVVKKRGFFYEGTSKHYLKINGKWEDHAHYVLLNEGLV
jgi:ribosomal-protein-alanine N-acetyltransferase